jgi:hypothetical protein
MDYFAMVFGSRGELLQNTAKIGKIATYGKKYATKN